MISIEYDSGSRRKIGEDSAKKRRQAPMGFCSVLVISYRISHALSPCKAI